MGMCSAHTDTHTGMHTHTCTHTKTNTHSNSGQLKRTCSLKSLPCHNLPTYIQTQASCTRTTHKYRHTKITWSCDAFDVQHMHICERMWCPLCHLILFRYSMFPMCAGATRCEVCFSAHCNDIPGTCPCACSLFTQIWVYVFAIGVLGVRINKFLPLKALVLHRGNSSHILSISPEGQYVYMYLSLCIIDGLVMVPLQQRRVPVKILTKGWCTHV